MIIALVGLFGSIMVGAVGLLGLAPQLYVTLGMMGIGVCTAIYLFIHNMFLQGIADVFIKARMSGESVGIILRNDKQLKFVGAKNKGGLAETKLYGKYLLRTDSIYNMENGTTGWLGYYKYGVPLDPKFIQTITKLREAGMKNIEDVEKFAASKVNVKDKDGNPVTIKGADLAVKI